MVQDPRLLVYCLRIRYDDATKVDKITDDIRAFFESHPGVDHKLPYKAALSDLATYSVDISITVRPRCHSWLCIVPYLTCWSLPHTSCSLRHFCWVLLPVMLALCHNV